MRAAPNCKLPQTSRHAQPPNASTRHTPQQQDTVHRELSQARGRGPAQAQDRRAAPHGRWRAAPGARPRCSPPRRPSPTRHAPPPTTTGCRKGGSPVISNRPLHRAMQQRCHHASESARSPPFPPMPRPRLQRAATVLREKVQLPIREQN
jgi:hypothetical protein